MEENRKVRVFAAYQIGTGINAKMVGDESKNKFELSSSIASEMMREIEEILAVRHAEDVKNGMVIIVHHFQIINI